MFVSPIKVGILIFTIASFIAGIWVCRTQAAEPPVPQATAEKKGNNDLTDSPEFAALKKEYQQAAKKYWQEQRMDEALKAIREAKTDQEKILAEKRYQMALGNNPVAFQYAGRLVEFAQKHPQDLSALSALILALNICPSNKDKILEALKAGYAARPEVMRVLPWLEASTDAASENFIQSVVTQNPDRQIQAQAIKVLLDSYRSAEQRSRQLIKDPAACKRLEEVQGKDQIERLLAAAERSKQQIPKLKHTLAEKYSDIFPDLSIGKPAPEFVSQGLDGKEVKLSAFKGRVVVLDIWTTWCGGCRAMIPHERAMVGRLKNEPFVLISISCDFEKETLTKFLAKEPMPWTQCWDGMDGIAKFWDVSYFPTIYVIDAKGVIRYKDLEGDRLEKAVNALLREMETKN